MLTMAGEYTLPVGLGQRYLNHGPAAYILGNWQANTAVQLRSGQPYNLDVSGDVANIEAPAGDSWFTYESRTRSQAPRFPIPPRTRRSTRPLSRCLRLVPSEAPEHRRSIHRILQMRICRCSRTFLYGTSLINLRAEVFNVFNIQNYGVPDTNVIQQDPNAGRITSTVSDSPREIQLGVHLNF